jgi:peptide-methionine (S)-S-oxide reductase
MRFSTSRLLVVGLLVGVTAALFLKARFAMPEPTSAPAPAPTPPEAPAGLARATLGNGCFWCTEAVFQRLKGVHSAVSGYCGGHVKNPTYRQVCTGTTGHAEVLQITYDPAVISYEELLDVFWQTHDPTTRDRQGNDVGPQYRSVIFYHDDEQKKTAEAFKEKLDAARVFAAPIVTEIVPAVEFYRAEDYHQDFLARNPSHPYIVVNDLPKIAALKRVFADFYRAKPGLVAR